MLTAVTTKAAEFHEDDILPTVEALIFTHDEIATTLESSTYLGKQTMRFVAKRDDYEFRQVPDRDYSELLATNHYHRQLSGNVRLRDGDGRYELDQRGLILSVSNDCGPESQAPTHVSHADFEFTISLQCGSRVHDAVRTNDHLWLATFVDPEYSYDSGISPEGIVVASLDGNVEARIGTGNLAMHGLAVDPWAQDVWVVTQDRIMQATQDFDVERQFWPILDFDVENERPATIIKDSSVRLRSNPLALIARGIGEPHYHTFFKTSKEWPDLRNQDIMYNYAMNGPDWSSMPMLPKQLNVLVDDAEPTASWRKFLCLLDDKQAKKLCALDLDMWP